MAILRDLMKYPGQGSPCTDMKTWIALLRGINVGRTRSLPMKSLVELLHRLGASEVRTCIQSGNVVFRRPAIDGLAEALRAAIHAEHGFEPEILLFDCPHLRAVIDANPFHEADSAPTTVHIFFLDRRPATPDLAMLDRHRSATERYVLTAHALYLHTPDGFGKSKLAGRAERALGVPATARNVRTAMKLLELAESR